MTVHDKQAEETIRDVILAREPDSAILAKKVAKSEADRSSGM